ncbi:hypothetical protein HELRODRAFT_164091 [Helobdella robusta]|uniref:Uncharacterized protein n=1 Tax=Helobdella robusta TaxID=6412 RepID=T1EUX0_HELRO|nr:hypothetical protein HELRODRAFT_164091 [Helobdella robusta]ESN94280.1 hypothetical protein HELRODRAFT_164091 [Helobdella robusta]
MVESTRKKQDIYLLGQPLKTAILGNKLPAKGEMMRRFLYIHLSEKMTVRDSETDVIREIQEDRKFLLAQREPGRRGYMSGVDKNLALKETRLYERKRRQENYKLNDSSSSECESEEDSIAKRVQVKRSRKSFSMSHPHCAVSRETAAALDRTKTSDRKATYIISGVAKHLGLNAGNLAINRSSIRRARHKHRQELALEIRRNFSPDVPLAVHWDGKLLLDLTASNTGKKNGACTLLQQKLGRNVLHIACRHHISEIILEHAFSACMSSNTSGPKIALFLRFRNEFNSIDQADYHTIMDDESMNCKVEQHKEGIVSSCLTQLEQFQPRCDYRELLELSLILLGETPPRGVRVLQPGALHRARWMARLIYALKLYMYRHQFLLTRVEKKGICRFIVFGICWYLRSWFTVPDLLSAARHDLQLVKRIQQFRDVDREVSVAAANALSRHLWYVSEEFVGAAFFDDQISHEEKVLMVDALSVKSKTTNDFTKRVLMNINDISDEMSAKDFVSSNTMQFFAILGLPHSFLNKRPSEWREDEQYKKAFEVVSGIKPVNDFAKRGVALMQDFNRAIVSSEEQKQYLLQVVEYHRTQYPNPKKETLVGGNTSP